MESFSFEVALFLLYLSFIKAELLYSDVYHLSPWLSHNFYYIIIYNFFHSWFCFNDSKFKIEIKFMILISLHIKLEIKNLLLLRRQRDECMFMMPI